MDTKHHQDWKTSAYIVATGLAGLAVFVVGFRQWESRDIFRFLCYVMVAAAAARMKVTLPGVKGTMSVNFVFILLGVLDLSLSETLVVGCLSVLLQCVWSVQKRPSLRQLVFNIGSIAVAIYASYEVYHALLHYTAMIVTQAILLAVSASVLFLTNTLPVAMIISLTEGKSVHKIWQECYFWSFPGYLVGAAIAGLFDVISKGMGWQLTMLVLPVVYWIYHSYRLYAERLEGEKAHAEAMSNLHLRTIEALALAIDAKDHTTQEHLSRVQVYALEIAEEMKLPPEEKEALRAAALLHDIGKLAVPEHIISKPGKLTPEEFEKMKIHPIVGAEILERVQFPYPVVPIVRCHHEKWDGTGYPAGLCGEEIPLGARILSAVDCLDALASDRQYRRAYPFEVALSMVMADSGKSFDPRVVEILARRHAELEQKAHGHRGERTSLSKNIKIEKGMEPAAGFEDTNGKAPSGLGWNGHAATTGLDFLTSIAAARQEVQSVFELTKELGSSLRLDETLSFLDVRLKKIIPYDAIAIYLKRDQTLIPEFVNGENLRLFSSLEIPIGEGLSGWVADHGMPIINGSPSVEPGYLNDAKIFSTLGSALAVPLEGSAGLVGVLTLYRREKDAFTKDQLRIVQGIAFKVAMSIENALKFRQAEKSATTDGLTGLPNARSLFLHLDSELARCRREESSLSILVCDLDGFKQVNDQFGHLEGNRILQHVAQGLQECCRSYDYVARMGGDEFVIVLPNQKASNLQSKIDLLTEVVERAGQMVCGTSVLGLSVGEAAFPRDGEDAEQILAEADRKMYKNKESHRAHLRIRPVVREVARPMDRETEPHAVLVN